MIYNQKESEQLKTQNFPIGKPKNTFYKGRTKNHTPKILSKEASQSTFIIAEEHIKKPHQTSDN